MCKEIRDRRSEVMVWIHQPASGDDAMPIVVCIIAEGNVESVFQTDQFCHGIWRRTVHANLSVPIDGHEAEGRVHCVVHDLYMNTVAFDNRPPVGDARSAKRINTDLELGASNDV